MSPADLSASLGVKLSAPGSCSFGALHLAGATADESVDLEELRRSGLFDPAFYLTNQPELARAGLDPLLHYLRQGWQEGRRPNPYFDPAWYVTFNLDVRAMARDPLLHYIRYGEKEGRRPVLYFDPAWYRATYRLAERESSLLHFLQRRFTGEVSPLAEFDSGWYLRNYPDVARAGMDPLEHYLVQGYKENRNPSPRFDTRFYKRRYLRETPSENPLLHYLRNCHVPGIQLSRLAEETTIPREMRRNTRPGPEFEEVKPLPPDAPRRAMVLAYYLPQFHTIAENDAWWGRGFTEWTNLGRALPRFVGHYQPRIPRDLGHYRLEGTATLRRQIELAQGAGLFGFVFYFYWFDGHRLLESPVEAFLNDPGLAFPFCLMWANESWTRQWDGSEQQVLISHHYLPEDEPALIATFARHFADPRYIRLEGRPLLMIYRPGVIPDVAASVSRWRDRFQAVHGENPIFVMSQAFGDIDPTVSGMDGAIEFPPHKLVEGATVINADLTYLDDEFSAQVYDYSDVAAQSTKDTPSLFPLIRTVIPGWDNDARRQGAGLVVHGSTPLKYQAWLEKIIQRSHAELFFGTSLVCINAWNEWTEGAYLEPDAHFGAAYLNATGRAIAGMPAAGSVGRLLLVGHDAFPSGAQHLLLHLGRKFVRRHGLRVEFLLLAGGALLPEYEALGPVTMAQDELAIEGFLAGRHAAGIRSALVNTSVAAFVCTALKRVGIASVLLVHELPRLLRERNLVVSAGKGAAVASRVVFADQFVRDRFIEVTGLPVSGTLVLRQGCYRQIVSAPHARTVLRRDLGVPPDTILAAAVGYADLRKGFDVFMQIWHAIQRRRLNVHLIWIGDIDPTMRNYLGAEMLAAVATGSLHLPGWREDVGDLLSAADVLLLTSREDPFPAAVLEGLSAGLPVIAFDGSGGIPELLRRHNAGVSVKMADAEAMARRIVGVARAGRARVARAARVSQIRQEYCFDTYASSLLKFVQPALLSISVAILSYNYARYLPTRMASIFTQTYPVEEIIVFDDASRDHSVALARQTAARWEREVKIITNTDNSRSVFRQWQRAAELSTSEFLWIAEADDGSDPCFLEKLAQAIAAVPDAVMAFSDSRCIDENDRTIRSNYQQYYTESAGPGALARDDVFQADGFARRFLVERNLILNVSSVLWRRSALLAALRRCEAELSSWRVAGDWRLYLELLAGSIESVVYVAAPLNVHRCHGQSVTQQSPWALHVREVARAQGVAARKLGIGSDALTQQKRYLKNLRSRVAEGDHSA